MPTLEEITYLLKHQKVAHKLLATLYKQLMVSVDRILKNIGFKFKEWHPYIGNFPDEETNPLKKNVFFYLPFYSCYYVYIKNDHNYDTAQFGDYVIYVRIILDNDIISDDDQQRIKYKNCDQIDINSSSSTIDFLIYRCEDIHTHNLPFFNCIDNNLDWQKSYTDSYDWDDLECHDDVSEVNDVDIEYSFYVKTYKLEDFLHDNDSVENELKTIVSEREECNYSFEQFILQFL